MSHPQTMVNDAKAALTPKLRFPEFRDGAAWQGYRLEDLEALGWVELGRGEVISNQDIKSVPGTYPIYSSSVKNNGLMGTYGRFMFDEELISWSVDGGGNFFHRPRHKFSVTNVSGYMRLDPSQLNYRFTASQLQALHSKLTFDYQLKAHPSVIRKLYRLALPSLAEQEKIAECLSTLDELIGSESQKLDALKVHKKGLMHQLFPREGETLPRLRFPEFQDAMEWEEGSLGRFVDFESGGTPSKQNPTFWNGTIPWISAKDMKQMHLDDTQDHLTVAAVQNGTKLVPGGTVLMLIRGMTLFKDVPICVVNRPMAFNQDIKALRATADVCQSFLPHLLIASKERLLAMVDSAGHGTGRLNTDELKSLKLAYPRISEQARIVDCLDSIEALTQAQADKVKALTSFKIGLMQQIFPSPETEAA